MLKQVAQRGLWTQQLKHKEAKKLPATFLGKLCKSQSSSLCNIMQAPDPAWGQKFSWEFFYLFVINRLSKENSMYETPHALFISLLLLTPSYIQHPVLKHPQSVFISSDVRPSFTPKQNMRYKCVDVSVNSVMISCCRFQIFERFYIFEGFVSYFSNIIFSWILVTSHEHVLNSFVFSSWSPSSLECNRYFVFPHARSLYVFTIDLDIIIRSVQWKRGYIEELTQCTD
jgi:hypothetical protein